MATILLATLDHRTGRAVLDAAASLPIKVPYRPGVESMVLAAASLGHTGDSLLMWRDRLLDQGWLVHARFYDDLTGVVVERRFRPRGGVRSPAEVAPLTADEDTAPPSTSRPRRSHRHRMKFCVTCGRTGLVIGRHLKETGHERWEYVPETDETDTPAVAR